MLSPKKMLAIGATSALVVSCLGFAGITSATAAEPGDLRICVKAHMKIIVDLGQIDRPRIDQNVCLPVYGPRAGWVFWTQSCNPYGGDSQVCEPYRKWKVTGVQAKMTLVTNNNGPGDLWHYSFQLVNVVRA
ncbi:hypothetical protein AB0P21_40975 [Kribbella sp. NPDC056861]|uniref:hypothetical protein n=1 Tax=Kribbella sp. NPDC056861 TaxID=3154857 RepID=UPI003443C4FA